MGVVAVNEMKTLYLPTLLNDFICKVMAGINGRNWGRKEDITALRQSVLKFRCIFDPTKGQLIALFNQSATISKPLRKLRHSHEAYQNQRCF